MAVFAGRVPGTFTSTVNYATEPTADPAVWVIRPDEFIPDPARCVVSTFGDAW